MWTRKTIFIFCLALLLLSIASVSANDLDDIAIQSSDDTIDNVSVSDFPETGVDSDECAIQSSDDTFNDENNPDTVSSANDNEILGRSFTDLQGYINGADEGGVLVLDDDYSIEEGGHTLVITKSLTIDGAGHSLTGDDSSTILCIDAREKSVILKNIVFWHGGSSDEGGAILNNRSSSNLTLINCVFYFNTADTGGAVYSYGNLIVNSSTFENSNASGGNGGAIHCEKDLYVSNSEFTDNNAGNLKLNVHSGGAIYCKGKCHIESCDFYTNLAKDGSAIYCCDDLTITGRTGGNIFTKNEASFSTIYGEKNVYINWDRDSSSACTMQFNTHESTGAIRCEGNLYARLLKMYKNEAGGGPKLGVAIYCEGETHINSSEFEENIYTPEAGYYFALYEAHGGAIWSNGKCYIDSCQFTANFALKGGAIYACDDLTITGKNNLFKDNQLDKEGKSTGISYDKDGGAIYCCGNLFVNNTDFINNSATIDGGAIYCEKECRIHNCKFDSNIVTGYLARPSYGGAICTNKLIVANNCSFYSNNANPSIGTDCYGGAVYIISKCDPEFISCIFDHNECQMRGGAIYTDAEDTNLKIINSSFNHNIVDVDGGAIYCKGKTTISGCEFKYDRANGNSIYEGSFGGSVYSLKSVTIEDSKFENCHANNVGGAIYTKGEIKVSGSNFTNNNAKVDGGAIYADGKTTISNCTFKDNEATGEVSGKKSYGGAVRSNGFASIENSTFDDNFAYNLGGAIYVNGGIDIINSLFSGNKAYVDGGAVYAEGETYIYNSKFEKNNATGKTDARSFGGAVRSNGDTTVDTCIFDDNYAYNNGGALYSNKETTIKKSTFTDNEANDDGGAVYSEKDATVTDSMFRGNSVEGGTSRRAFGGGLCSYGKVTLKNTNFYDNYANNRGGAVFAFKEITIKDCTFVKNYAQYYGGAIWTRTINTIISNSIFNDNHAMENDGGAVYINNSCEPEFSSCTFDSNEAEDRGGAIYVDSKDAPLKLSSSTFIQNEAGKGGAVYTGTMGGKTTYSLFFRNKATSGDGGAIYIFNNCDPKFISCRFENNEAEDRGGALYLDSRYAELHLGYCTFVDNKAANKGHSVFNSGFYEEIKQCWLGENNPSLKNQFKEWHAWPAADTDFTDFSPAGIVMTLNTILPPYIGNTYNVTVKFLGAEYQYYDLLHSSAKFYGDKVIYSNEKVDMNDMTAQVVFTDKNPTIKLKLDHQVVTLSPIVREKKSSEVIISSCEDINYPNALKVDYEITNMTDNATYVIIDEYSGSGEVVREGKITNPKSTLTIEDLNPGKYYIRIDNHQNYTTSASRAIAHFTVYMLVSANVTADNVTYGTPTTITLKADCDGIYNVSVNGMDLEMEVVDGICVKQVKFDVGEYQTHTSYIGNCTKMTCNEASFAVYKALNHVVVSVEDAIYGNPSVIMVSADVEGNYKVDVNGTIYDIYVNDGCGEKTVYGLNAGDYFANASFNNDDYDTIIQNDTFTVYKADIDLVIVVFDELYGQDIEGIIYASADGDYNLTVAGQSSAITVINNLAYFNIGSELEVGSYEANVSFAGNENYYPAFNKTSFEVHQDLPLFEIKVTPDVFPYGQTAIVIHELPDDASGTIKYFLHDGTFLGELPVSENLTLPVLNMGFYGIIANYSGDHNHAPAMDAVLILVDLAPNNVVVNVDNVTYGDDVQIVVSADVDGNYQLDVNGRIYNVTVDNGVGRQTISGLNAGVYYANVTFDSWNYNTSPKNAVFEVYKACTNMAVISLDTVYTHDLEGIILSDVDGEYNVTVGDFSTVVTVKDGLGEFNAGLLNAGNYTIYANYSGDENHKFNSTSYNVTVFKLIPNLKFTLRDINYGEVETIRIKCDIQITVSVTVNGITESLTLNGEFKKLLFATALNALGESGSGTLALYGLDAGTYPVTIDYAGDENIEGVSLSGEFKVSSINPDMEIDSNDISVGEDEKIIVSLPSDATGNVTVTVDGKNYSAKVKDGKAIISIPDLSAGNKQAKVSYSGDNNYYPAEDTVSFAVNKLKPGISAKSNGPIKRGEKLHVTVKIPKDATGTVTLNIDGKNYSAKVKKGKAVFDISGLKAGKYKVKAYYSGDEKYFEDQVDLSVTVKDNNKKHDNNTDPDKKDDNGKDKKPSDKHNYHSDGLTGINVTIKLGNPILAILLSLMAIGIASIRRFEK